MGFTHLHVHSNFSFLDGGSSVEALIDRAREIGCDSLAITDHNGLYGAVRFYKYAKKVGIKPIIGVEMTMEGGFHIVLLAKNLNGYSNLCKIVTRAQLGHEKGNAQASLDILARHKEDLFCLSGCKNGEIPSLLLRGRTDEAREAARRYIEIFGRDNFFIELQHHLLPGDTLLNAELVTLADSLGVRTVATNNAHYAVKDDFKIQDILVCVRTLTTLDDEHEQRKRNSEYYLKTPREMAEMFRRYPKAVIAAGWIADRCDLDLGLGTYRFPDFPVPEGETSYSYLCKLCFDGLERLYKPITPQAVERLQHELKVIHDLNFAEYFLAVWDIVRYARSNGIRCSGRGSAADSIVAYCLDITIADPLEHELLFERFLNPERAGMPDIDIDFDAARRDEVIAYIYERYGEDKVALVCTVSTLCARSSIRDIGKAMDFPPGELSKLAGGLPHTGSRKIRESLEKYPELKNSGVSLEKFEALVDVCAGIDSFPRHLSVHLGGVVISRGLLTDFVPLEWATKGVIVSQFDKDDIEALGLVKMDLLGLRNLSAIEDALAQLKERGIELDIDNLPPDDPKVYRTLRSTKTVGLFQVESPGMRGLLGRLQPERFEDIIAQVSLFRPGPMQADMITPFIARRHGEESVVYPHPSLEPILKSTYGVILYQEQILEISSTLAGFSLGQADMLRRAMTTDRSQEEMEKIHATFVEAAVERGVERDVAEEVFRRLRAFAAYGFCKAHAASFAKIAYQTAYLKAYHPAEFLAGILSNEPMGFYPANVIVEEARRIGIRILGVDVNRSEKKFTVEWGERCIMNYKLRPAIRVALSQVKGISEAEVESILASRAERPFESFSDFCSRTRVDRPVLENLVNCGAFDSFGHQRGKLLWLVGRGNGSWCMVHGKRPTVPDNTMNHEPCTMNLFDGLSASGLDDCLANLPDVPELTPHERVKMDYEILGLSPICHPMVFYREKLSKAGVISTRDLMKLPHNSFVKVAGVVVVCMRPPTRSGTTVVFVTLEDEDGLVDTVTFPKVYEKYGRVIYGNPGLIIEGTLQRLGKRGISIVAGKVSPLGPQYRTDEPGFSNRPFAERVRSAGSRSWVKGTGV